MNKLIRVMNNGVAEYRVECEDGTTFKAERWYEKKTDAWHVHLPKNNPTGREYIRESKVPESGVLEFESKTTGPRTLTATNWRSRLTADETKELEQAEATIERLKAIGLSRKPESDKEKLERISRHNEQLIELLKAKGIDLASLGLDA